MFKRIKRLYCGIVGHKEFLFPTTEDSSTSSTLSFTPTMIKFRAPPYKALAKFCARCDMLYWETTRGVQDLADVAEFPFYAQLFKEWEADKVLREKHPGLQKQWDSYQMHKRLLKP